jgi:hypothetical protein
MDLIIASHNLFIIRKVILISVDRKLDKPVACCLELGSNNILALCYIYSEGYKCRRNVDLA